MSDLLSRWAQESNGKAYHIWLEHQIEELEEEAQASDMAYDLLLTERDRLRRALDNIKVRSYELGQRELHDMALEALREG